MSYILDPYTTGPKPEFMPMLRLEFAPLARRSCERAPEGVEPIKTIVMPGALYEGHGARLTFRDNQMLGHTFKMAARYGVPIDPDFIVQVRNLAYNDNVLAQPRLNGKEAQLWLQSLVYNPPVPMISPPSFYTQLAEQHFEPGIWPRTASASGAWAVVTFAHHSEKGGRELTVADFSGSHFVPMPHMKIDKRLEIYRYDASGVLMRPDMARHYPPVP